MEDAAGELVAGTEGAGVDQVAVMAKGHVALHMADDNGLDVVVVLAAGGGIADVAHGDVALAQAVQAGTVEDFAHQAVALQVMEDAVAGNRDAAAFLTPVLQGVEPEVHIPGNSTLDGRPDAEYAALLMHKAGTSEKRERRPSESTEGRLCPFDEGIVHLDSMAVKIKGKTLFFPFNEDLKLKT